MPALGPRLIDGRSSAKRLSSVNYGEELNDEDQDLAGDRRRSAVATLVVDTGLGKQHGETVLREVRKVSGDKPLLEPLSNGLSSSLA
jgi:hypothetical protein